MTEPSTTTPTLEQRAATITELCPPGWSVKAHGTGLAVYSAGLSDVPNRVVPLVHPEHCVMHGSDMGVLATIWGWRAGELEQVVVALKDLAGRLGCAAGDSLPGFFERQTTGFAKRVLGLVHRALGRDLLAEEPAATPIRAYDAVAELAQEHAAVRKKWSGAASERDDFWKVLRALGLGDAETLADFTTRWLECAHALEVAKKHIATTEREGVRNGEEMLRLHAAVEAAEKLVTKREADIFDLRNEVEALKKAAEVAPIDRDMLADALDCARREVVWVPESASQAGQTDETRESEQVRDAIEWCTTHAGRGLAAELAQDAANKVQTSLATMTGRPTMRWAIAQALHIGAETAVAWAEGHYVAKLEAQQVELRQLREDQADYQALLDLQRARRDLSIYEADSCDVTSLAAIAVAKFNHLPRAIEARSYDIKRRAKIAVRIEPDPAKPQVVGTPAAVIAAMFPLARRLVIIDQHAVVDGDDPRAHIINADVPHSREQEQAAVVCSVMPTGEINVLKNRQDGKLGLITPQEGVTFASMTWTGSAWVPAKPPVPVAVGETEAGPHSTRETLGAAAFAAKYGVPANDPALVAAIPKGWTGITWMSGKGRAKSLTLQGLRLIDVNGGKAKLRADVAGFTDKAKRVFNKAFKRGTVLAFHLPSGIVRHAKLDCYAMDDHSHPQAEAGDIFVWLPETKAVAPKPARQGIAWRRPGHDVDSFHEAKIRPTYDNVGNHVIEVHDQLPDDLQAEIRQVMRDRPTITATTVNGTKFTGPVIAWEQKLGSGGVVWRLTVPLHNPTPRT